MGELLKQLRKDNMQAMKDHDSLKKGVFFIDLSNCISRKGIRQGIIQRG
jgi:hypothetical protein